jgi:alkanesulfonate monooxygenase SsuD/methylene tetrahydromethanopterin reductase-like flavin-dependent oxidoreductase (luciferase family)
VRFSLYETTAVSVHEVVTLAVEAERLGFDNFALNDGTFQFPHTAGTYPYSVTGQRNWDIESPFYDPMTILPALGLLTSRIRIFPAVLKLPLHNPVLLAKKVATAAIMCDDRFALGVGASWDPAEYAVCGADWHRRGSLVAESVKVLREVLTGNVYEHHSTVIDFGPLLARPAPRRPVKILAGGHKMPSLRRAAQLCDGWIAGPMRDLESLAHKIDQLRGLCDEYGRDWDSFEIHYTPVGQVNSVDYRRLQDLGVTDAGTLPINTGDRIVMNDATRQRLSGYKVLAAQNPDSPYDRSAPEEKLEAIRGFAVNVIAEFH